MSLYNYSMGKGGCQEFTRDFYSNLLGEGYSQNAVYIAISSVSRLAATTISLPSTVNL